MIVQLNEDLQMAGGEHGEIGAILIGELITYVHNHKLGRVFNAQTTFKIGGTQLNQQPDGAFVTLERMPTRIKGDIPFAPDLVFEVISQSDVVAELDQRIDDYLQAGVRLIWIVRPSRRIVEVYRVGNSIPGIVGEQGELDGEEVIPGFKLAVSKLFD